MNSYLSYLQNSLGLEHIILPVRTAPVAKKTAVSKSEPADESVASAVAVRPAIPLSAVEVLPPLTAVEKIEQSLKNLPSVVFHFQIVNSDELKAEEHELFHKIMEALKLPSASYIMTSGPTEVTPKATHSVVFTDFGDRYGEWISVDNVRTMRTYSIHAMLLNPSLKKDVWAHLRPLKN